MDTPQSGRVAESLRPVELLPRVLAEYGSMAGHLDELETVSQAVGLGYL